VGTRRRVVRSDRSELLASVCCLASVDLCVKTDPYLAGARKLPNLTEAQARKGVIDPALRNAGVDVNNPDQVGTEIPVDGFSPEAWRALEAELRRMG
jgi:hypothetical protein